MFGEGSSRANLLDLGNILARVFNRKHFVLHLKLTGLELFWRHINFLLIATKSRPQKIDRRVGDRNGNARIAKKGVEVKP